MVSHGYPGDPWGGHVDPMGIPCSPMGPNGSPCRPAAPHAVPMGPHGLGTHGCPWVPKAMAPHEATRVPMGSPWDPHMAGDFRRDRC